ncbi:hypothetical protein RIF29_37420 [Crotalaria pallida]|uniref:Remorin C-terminal domain-containing protein n=1 Tax=Crotalaria pallida TaxID=3830 RepID=A0AAN9ECF8_CROPI
MVEEGSNYNKTESEPQSVASILETEEPEKPVSQEEEAKEQVTSLVVQSCSSCFLYGEIAIMTRKAHLLGSHMHECRVCIFYASHVNSNFKYMVCPADVADSSDRKDTGDSINNRDAELARVVAEKRAYKRLSTVGLWEDTKKASVEAQLKKIEENLEKRKAEYVERMKNKVADIHRSGQEKRAIVEAQKKEDILEVEETAAKFRSRGNTPRSFFTCFSGKAW